MVRLNKICSVEGCGRLHRAKGFCARHYHEMRYKHGELGALPCKVEGCIRPGIAKGLCNFHYDRKLHNRIVEAPRIVAEYVNTSGQLITKEWLISFTKQVPSKLETPCWEWQRSKNKDGYGVLGKKDFKTDKAHRISYEIFTGPIPDGMKICHRCDNPPCINPDHLFAGSTADNNADSVAKGRQNYGEKIRSAKLTDEKVMQIRFQVSEGKSVLRVAKEFGVTKHAVYRILHGITWKHLFNRPVWTTPNVTEVL